MEQEIVQGIYYLKKCTVILQSPQPLSALLPLCERLMGTGIGCEIILAEELPEKISAWTWGEKSAEGILYLTDDPQAYGVLAAAYSHGRRGGYAPKAPAGEYDGDSPEVSAGGHDRDFPEISAGRDDGSAADGQPPVLIYLHEGNRDEDFGDARYALEEPEETEPEYLERVYRRCRNLPWEILVTERCWLRETVEEDVDSFWRMYGDEEITRYTERLYPTPEAERGYIREYRRLIYSFYEFGVWTVLDRRSGEIEGRAGLSVREGCDLPELGFVISREWQGRGLATEVCRGILEYARQLLGFDRIQVLVHEENAVSLHLCRELGFREQTAPASCPVEMEQNGQRARFVYMVYESNMQTADHDPVD